jgi:hypothetical protein
MSWRDPNAFEKALLADTCERWPEIIPLARCLTLAPRIEPLLLRNARRGFVPQAQAEVESLLWFSPLVAARSTQEIVLHLGVAKVLAEEVRRDSPEHLERLWELTRRHTRHWSPEDRLERDLRYYALLDDRDRVQLGLRDIVRRIRAEQDEKRHIALSRLAKRTIAVIAPAGQGPEEARLLAQYAALALGDAGSWIQAATRPAPPQALPAWLAAKLPPPISSAELGVEIRHDPERGQVLHLVAPDAAAEHIQFPSPLPARLHVAGEGWVGAWHSVSTGSRIRIAPPSQRLRLTTLDGRQWDLRSGVLEGGGRASEQLPMPLVLVFVDDDREQASKIAVWLREKGISVDLVGESAQTAIEKAPAGEARVVRLWTRAAQDFWAGRQLEQGQSMAGALLLRIEEVGLPAAGVAPGQVLNWRDWSRFDQSPAAEWLLRNLRRWRDGDEIEPGPGTDVGPEASGRSESYSAEVAALLAEIHDLATEPPRRLEIGDRLAELGDPRPGVGVIEIEVPLDEGAEPGAVPEPLPPEVRRLLDELDDPATEPPRRLEIGDELDRLGDPRHGVGLDENGLPDIEWVEIPAGPFIYQSGETRELPTFWIAMYPITNVQFQSFVDGGGYREERWWRTLRKPEPGVSRWIQGNRPRTNVDWYEAVAFTRWLTARLGLPEGTIRLPTEFEWEKAARGEKGLLYPWGNEYRSGFANIDETEREDGRWYLQQTTAVGMYPHGRSPFRVEDLAGNVWEWCLNEYDKPDEVRADTSADWRGLRGGSWIDPSELARADNRYRAHPGHRSDYGGFRVLSSVPIAVR